MTEYNDPLPSKTRRKLEMQDLQDVGLKIMDLKAGQQARLPLSDALRAALEEARRINHPDARRRHALYVGRLISDGDTDSLLTALDTLTDPVRQQRLQQWTEQVLACPGPGTRNRCCSGFWSSIRKRTVRPCATRRAI